MTRPLWKCIIDIGAAICIASGLLAQFSITTPSIEDPIVTEAIAASR